MSSSQPSSFCTLCTKSAAFELVGLLLSLSIYHPNATIYIISDSYTKTHIEEMSPQSRLKLNWYVELDTYTDLNRSQMEAKKIFGTFLDSKIVILQYALTHEQDSLFLDSDMIITAKINDIDHTKSLGVSPHYMKPQIEQQFGHYNAGMLWAKDKSIPETWRNFMKTSRFYEQACIEDLAKKYEHFDFPSNYNIQGWRRELHPQGSSGFDQALQFKRDTLDICYDGQPIKSIHTHFRDNRFDTFNKMFIHYLNEGTRFKELAIIFRVINGHWKIRIPKQPLSGLYSHANDSFREIPVLWKTKHKDIEVVHDTTTPHCWIVPNILLYDRPTHQWFNGEMNNCTLLLLGNGNADKERPLIKDKFKNIEVKPWIFWPRRPMLLEKLLKDRPVMTYEQRKVETVFIGNYENAVQKQHRIESNDTWKNVIQEFHCTSGSKHKFTQEEYLLKLRESKYGLCLRGFGEKCHREVELMAFGTVPIITPEVNVSSYMEPLQENIHFIRATPDSLKERLRTIDRQTWERMSKNCAEWFMRNVHSSQSWNTTISNILGIYHEVKSTNE
jgi:hypothetical protein